MILFEEALKIVETSAELLAVESVNLSESLGRVLAQDVFSYMDMPPFDKSAVDGYACRRSDLHLELRVLEVIPAGKVPTKTVNEGECSKLMTGGMLPPGADTVIMVEEVEITGENTIRFSAPKTAPNYCYRAEDIKAEEKVLDNGTLIRAQEIAILASFGCDKPIVFRRPKAGIISTGDELVEPSEKPALSQIRNSNAWQLLAQASNAGCDVKYYGIARDDQEITLNMINSAAAESDIVILTGGISAGDFDFVPAVIQRAGFDIKFRQLAVQPGKPVIFATKSGKYLFALPWNPVSSFVQFEMLVKHLLHSITGCKSKPLTISLPLGRDYKRSNNKRKAFFPVYLTTEGTAMPVVYHGSAHIHSYIQAQGIAIIELGEIEIKKGNSVHVRLI